MSKEFSQSATSRSFDNYLHNQQIKSMFGSIAKGYDLLNHTLSMGFDVRWRRVLVSSLAQAPEGLFLDLAAGTCDVSLALTKAYPARRILAADLCLPMLRYGMRKVHKQPCSVSALNADAYHLPLADNSVAAITVSFGLRNMVPHLPALAEMHRVLKPGGRLSVLEFGSARSKVWLGLYNWYLCRVLPRIGGAVSGDRRAYDYLARTITEFPGASELAAKMLEAGFDKVAYKKLSGGIVYVHSADKR